MSPLAHPETVYRERRARFGVEERRLARVSLRLSVARFAAFSLFAAGLLLLLVPAAGPRTLWLSVVGLVAFVALVIAHDRVARAERRAAELVRIQEEGLARLARDWPALPLPRLPESFAPPPLARDLDLFGRASLFHLLASAHTPPGRAALAAWLLTPASPGEIAERQAATSSPGAPWARSRRTTWSWPRFPSSPPPAGRSTFGRASSPERRGRANRS